MGRFYLVLALLLVVAVLDILLFVVWAPIGTPQFYLVLGVLMVLGYFFRRFWSRRSESRSR